MFSYPRESVQVAWQHEIVSHQLQPDRNPMPFDGKRLIYGGFEVNLDA
jgi:uncharacterized protein YbaA (DUF1428 family)